MTLAIEDAPAEQNSAGGAEAAPAIGGRYAWYVVGALAFANIFSYLERLIPTLLFAPIKASFHLSDTQVSLLAGFAFVLFYVGFGLLIGRLADRSNRRNIILVGVFLWSLATMVCGFTRSFVQLFAARVAVGVGEATLGPSATSMISDYFPRAKLARALSVYSASNYVGAGLGLVVGGVVIQLVASIAPPVLPFFGSIALWQMTFIAVGLLGLTVLIPMLFVREPTRRNVARDVAANGVSFAELFAFLRRNGWTFVTLYGAFSIHSILGFATFAWIPSYFVRDHGWKVQQIGYVYGLMAAVCGAGGVLLGARFAEWLEARGYKDAYLRAALISILIAAVPQFLSTLVPTSGLSLGLLTFSTLVGNMPVVLPIAALQAIAPNQMRAQVLAIYLFTANILGLGLGPTVVALITDHIYGNEAAVGYAISTATAIILPIVAVIEFFGLRPLRESLARAENWSAKTEGAA